MSGRKLTTQFLATTGNLPLSSTSVIYGKPISVGYYDNIVVQFQWTGTPTGSMFIDTSADYQQDFLGNVQNSGTWIPSGSTSVTQAAGTSGFFRQNFNQLSDPYMRVRYAPSSASSTGVLNVWINAKML